MSTFKVNDTELAFVEQGSGDALIFVHGALGDSRTWTTQMADFAARFRVIAYSRRWHRPNSSHLNGVNYTLDIHVGDLLAILESVGPAHLVGHSYGGSICALATLREPKLVRSLVLAEPSLFTLLLTSHEGKLLMSGVAEVSARVVSLCRQQEHERALREFLDLIFGADGIDRLPEPARMVMRENIHTLDAMISGTVNGPAFTARHAAQINIPTLLIEGEQSPPYFRRTLGELARALPNANTATLSAVSHGLHLEAAEAFNCAVLKFLAKA